MDEGFEAYCFLIESNSSGDKFFSLFSSIQYKHWLRLAPSSPTV